MALFEEYYDKKPEDEKVDKRPKIRRQIEKAFHKFYDNLTEQKEQALDELDEARKALSAGEIEKLMEIDEIFLTLQEIDLRIKNMKNEEFEYLG